MVPPPVEKTGFLQAADVNNLIVIFPQAMFQLRSIGCFDIYGYTSPFRNAYGKLEIIGNSWVQYRIVICDEFVIFTATRKGVQPNAVKQIYERVVNGH